jgi:two-component system alkaline phosphatase synthesis response regulator PhoP
MHTASTRVLVVHRNREFARRLREQSGSLDKDNIDLEFTENAETFTLRLPDEVPDAIVLDLTVPTPPGFSIHRVLHPRSRMAPPVVILRLRSNQRTKHRTRERWRVSSGIEALEARVHLALGRTLHRFSWLPVQFAGTHLTADLPNTQVLVDERAVLISAREGEVLALLLAHCNRVVRREVLISEIWGYETRSLDVHIRRLRRKLGSAGAQLETVTAFGYRFVEPGPASATTSKVKFTRVKQTRRESITATD